MEPISVILGFVGLMGVVVVSTAVVVRAYILRVYPMKQKIDTIAQRTAETEERLEAVSCYVAELKKQIALERVRVMKGEQGAASTIVAIDNLDSVPSKLPEKYYRQVIELLQEQSALPIKTVGKTLPEAEEPSSQGESERQTPVE